MYDWGGVKEKGVEIEEEYFFSTEIGSFTDITFASRVSSSHAAVGQVADVSGNSHVTSPVTDASHVTDAGHAAEAVKPSESATTKPKPESAESKLEVAGERGDEGGMAEKEDKATKLTITEAAAIIHNVPQSDQKPHGQEGEEEGPHAAQPVESSSAIPGVPSALEGVISHVKRTANSQSWSEDTAATSPVAIMPRPSSYSFSVENLPPLLSYDGGEEFSHSSSLNEGGAALSEEEQVRMKT